MQEWSVKHAGETYEHSEETQNFIDEIFALYFEAKVIKQTLKNENHFLVLPSYDEFVNIDRNLVEKREIINQLNLTKKNKFMRYRGHMLY